MKSRLGLPLLVVLLAALAPVRAASSVGATAPATQCAPAAAYPAAMTPVAFWSTEARCAIVPPGPRGIFGSENFGNKFPGEAAVYMGIVHVAIYDAAMAIEGGYQQYAIALNAPGASPEAAIAAAAHDTLVRLQKTNKLGLSPEGQSTLERDYAAYLAVIPDGQAKNDGVAVGRQVAAAVLALRANDGLNKNPTVADLNPPPAGPGVWQPNPANPPGTTPPPVLGLRLPGVRPLALQSASQFRPDGPNPLRSKEYAEDLNQVEQLGRVDSTVRTAAQTTQALFWTDHDIRMWNDGMLRLAAERGLDLVQTARMLAMAHVAGGDAMIACFDAKYHYWFWRPYQAITRADTDGNPRTVADPTWQPLRTTPNFPEYPSAHACHSSAIVEALDNFFATDNVPLTLDSRVTDTTRHYDRLHEIVKDVDWARVLVGFHFRNSDLQGSRLGRKVGRYVAEHYFQPVGCSKFLARGRAERCRLQQPIEELARQRRVQPGLVRSSGWAVGNRERRPGRQRAVHAPGANAWGRIPVGLRVAASSVIGASQPASRVVERGDRLATAGGGVRSSFDREGVTLSAASKSVRLVLAGVGRGGRLTPVRSSAPGAWRNSVTYRRGQVVEWYRTGPLGLEQGFTLEHRPAGRSGELAIGLRLGGSLRAALAHGDVVFLTHGGRVALLYGGLSAVDAAGLRLPARIELNGARLTLRVSDLGARYPLSIDPFIQQGVKLTGGTDETGAGEFGFSVALSADGNTALIGGDGDNGGVGAAWVFTRSGSTWLQQGPKLGASDENGAGSFGDSVALSADGNMALIGGFGDNGDRGAAWVFVRSGGVWTQEVPKLTASDEAAGGGRFGASVALSAGGGTALIGGPGDNSYAGAGWVFTFGIVGNHVGWLQQGAKLTASDETGAGGFGSSVALSAGGMTALIGGPWDNGGVGAAWVFIGSGSSWAQSSKLTGTDESGPGGFGSSVALSAAGDTALIAGTTDNNLAGAAWVFTFGIVGNHVGWLQQGPKLTVRGETGKPEFGSSVALSAGGDTALIGDPAGNGGAGAVSVFARSGSTWSLQRSKLTAAGSFGVIVALSADGHTALIGGLADNNFAGAAWVFIDPPVVAGVSPGSGPAAGGTAVTITGSGLGGASAVSFGSTPAASFVVNSPREITAVSPPGAIGPVEVTVRTSAGTSGTGGTDAFAYVTAPGAPTGLLAEGGDGQATVAFTAPPANGSPITAYTVTASPGGAHATGPASPITVVGLRNATTYTFTVTATNALGPGPPSAPSNPVTPTGPPSTPSNQVTPTRPVVLGAPTLSGLRLSPVAFRATRSGPIAITAADRNTETGTLVSYADSQAATTTFTVLQPRSGVRRGNACVRAPEHPPNGAQPKRCTRLVGLGSFTHTDRAGENRLRFTGRIIGHKLKPGHYQLRALARNRAGKTSPPLTTGFQITR